MALLASDVERAAHLEENGGRPQRGRLLDECGGKHDATHAEKSDGGQLNASVDGAAQRASHLPLVLQ